MATTRSKTRLQGEDELIRRLRALPDGFKPVLDAVAPAAERVRSAAAARAPSGSGGGNRSRLRRGREAFTKLNQSIIVWEKKRTSGFVNYRVGPSEKAPHGLWIELGHRVSRKKIASGGAVLGSAPPQPFLTPAWKESKNRVQRSIREKFREYIAKARRGEI